MILQRDQLPKDEPAPPESPDRTKRQEAAERARLNHEDQNRRTAAAKGTPEGLALIEAAKAVTAEALLAYARGQLEFEREFPWKEERRVRDRSGRVTRHTVEGDLWRFFQVRIKKNGRDPKADASRVIVFDFGADWLRTEIEALMDEAGYRRTIYYLAIGSGRSAMYHEMAYKLAYSLVDL